MPTEAEEQPKWYKNPTLAFNGLLLTILGIVLAITVNILLDRVEAAEKKSEVADSNYQELSGKLIRQETAMQMLLNHFGLDSAPVPDTIVDTVYVPIIEVDSADTN